MRTKVVCFYACDADCHKRNSRRFLLLCSVILNQEYFLHYSSLISSWFIFHSIPVVSKRWRYDIPTLPAVSHFFWCWRQHFFLMLLVLFRLRNDLYITVLLARFLKSEEKNLPSTLICFFFLDKQQGFQIIWDLILRMYFD